MRMESIHQENIEFLSVNAHTAQNWKKERKEKREGGREGGKMEGRKEGRKEKEGRKKKRKERLKTEKRMCICDWKFQSFFLFNTKVDKINLHLQRNCTSGYKRNFTYLKVIESSKACFQNMMQIS